MVLPRHGNHTLCSWLYRWFLLSFAHLLCCHSCQLFMDVHCFPLLGCLPNLFILDLVLVPGTFGSSALPSLSQETVFVNSYLWYPSPTSRHRYLIMTENFVDLLEMFFHALWQLAEVNFTRISWNCPIIIAWYIWVYSDQQIRMLWCPLHFLWYI